MYCFSSDRQQMLKLQAIVSELDTPKHKVMRDYAQSEYCKQF